MISELSVEIHNAPGGLAQITQVLDNNRIKIDTLMALAFDGNGLARLVCGDSDAAILALSNAGVLFDKTNQIVVRDVVNPLFQPGQLARLFYLLARAHPPVYVCSIYIVSTNPYHAAIMLAVDNPDVMRAGLLLAERYGGQQFTEFTCFMTNHIKALADFGKVIDTNDSRVISLALTSFTGDLAIAKLVVDNPEVTQNVLSKKGYLPQDPQQAEHKAWLIHLPHSSGALHAILKLLVEEKINLTSVYLAPDIRGSQMRVVVVVDSAEGARNALS